jgi:hypothetical protein
VLPVDCEQFDDRLQDRLDRRQPLRTDRRLNAHARVCSECRETLSAWSAFERRLPASRLSQRPILRAGLIAAALYAAVLVVPWSSPASRFPDRESSLGVAHPAASGLADRLTVSQAGISFEWQDVLPSLSARLSNSAANTVMPFAKGLRPLAESVQEVTVRAFQRSVHRAPDTAAPIPQAMKRPLIRWVHA